MSKPRPLARDSLAVWTSPEPVRYSAVAFGTLTALTVFADVMTARLWLVVPALVIQAALGLIALDHVLTEWSDHGDNWLIVFGLAVGATGALANVLTARSSRGRDGR